MSAVTLSSPLVQRRLPGSFGRLRWLWATTVVWSEEFRYHPLECLVLVWQTRFGKNAMLSIGAWVILYGVFNVEVSCLDIDNRLAKLLWSIMGMPSGLAIQWFVFGDRVMALRESMSWRRLTARLSWRLVTAKTAFFFANLGAYIAAALLLPCQLAAPVAAIVMSVAYYAVTLRWITRSEETESA